MIKQAYFRGLMKVAQAADKQMSQQAKDMMLLAGSDRITGNRMKAHGFYKNTPFVTNMRANPEMLYSPGVLRYLQAYHSTDKFAPGPQDPVRSKLLDYYHSIGRQNRDFYLKQGFRPPKDHKYKTQFPYPNHPQKKQMLDQNQWQVNNNRGQQYSGHS